MKRLKVLFQPLRDFLVRHPAILSGYIIYGYFFISTMGFYRSFKEAHFKFVLFDYVKSFDSLIWMWLLAVVLVKVIEYRSRIDRQEKERLEQKSELEVRRAQLQTMQEMIRTLQHEINNPLTIIFLYVQKAEKRKEIPAEARDSLLRVREAAERIATTLRQFSVAQEYKSVDSPVGRIAKPG